MATNGWSELGALLGGAGRQSREQAYQAGVTQGARSADLLEQARQRRDQNIGLERVTPSLVTAVASGIDPVTGQTYMPEVANQFQGELVSAMLHAGIDPRQFSGYQKDQQGIDWGNQAMAAATAPDADLNLVNRMNMVRNGKPVELSTIQGNTLLNAMVTPDQQAANGGNIPTQVGLAEMMDRAASARAHDAAAANSYAHARTAGQGGGGGAPSGYRFQPDGSLAPIPGGPADKVGAPSKPLPAAALRMQQDELTNIQNLEGINSRLGDMLQQMEDGKLTFGPLTNLINAGMNFTGASNEASRNYASARANLEKMRNDSLRLNKGVQTEGDAQRAWNELFANLNDPAVFKQRLEEIQGYNKQAENYRRYNIDTIRQNYGAGPLEDMPLLGGAVAGQAPSGRAIVKTGTTPDGRRVVQYSDGSVDYAD